MTAGAACRMSGVFQNLSPNCYPVGRLFTLNIQDLKAFMALQQMREKSQYPLKLKLK